MGNREGRSSRRGEKKKGYGNQPTGANPTPIENVKPLEKSANRWTPRTVGEGTKKEATSDDGIPSNEVIIRKVKSLLNKLTLEKFESISNQIVDFARLSAKTGNGQILELVIQLIFEKAIDEMNFCSIYALLCQNMMGRLDDVRSDDYKNNKGEPLAGSQLFRRYLLSRCQFEFEKGWRLDTEGIDVTDPSFIMSDQYYELQKQKRHGLGLVAFVGELYKMGMLSDKVVHGCIIKLLSNFENPVEEEVESLCKLMTTCGKQISESKVLSLNMDKYFRAIQALSVNKNLPSRFRCLLLDVIDLRK
ncbi:armadillo-type protein, partial [Dimargaris cristalligena]